MWHKKNIIKFSKLFTTTAKLLLESSTTAKLSFIDPYSCEVIH